MGTVDYVLQDGSTFYLLLEDRDHLQIVGHIRYVQQISDAEQGAAEKAREWFLREICPSMNIKPNFDVPLLPMLQNGKLKK